MNIRMSKEMYYLGIAKAVAERSTCLKRKYGAVIVKDDEIIACGYNGSPRGEENCNEKGDCPRLNVEHGSNYEICKSVHAEMNAIISASRKDMLGSVLYLYGEEEGKVILAEPCSICSRLIKNAGIIEVVGSKSITVLDNTHFKMDINKDTYLLVYLETLGGKSIAFFEIIKVEKHIIGCGGRAVYNNTFILPIKYRGIEDFTEVPIQHLEDIGRMIIEVKKDFIYGIVL